MIIIMLQYGNFFRRVLENDKKKEERFIKPFNNLKLQISRAFMASLICAIGFGLVALFISDQKIRNFDDTIIYYIQGMESPQLTKVMIFFTNIGAGLPASIIAIVTMVILYVFLGHRRELILFISVMIGSTLLNSALKLAFHRARPTIHRIIEANGYSFPSGHSMAAFSLYGVIAFLLWKHVPSLLGRVIIILVCALLILIIGISRIYLGVHYPSDVAGGYLMSGCLLGASIWFYQRYLERKR
ncbi:undecaprenyl-diphosphatase [Paenibacillus sediminis]|uniref:Undecaprenyl-diphosphatase n=2 Tax=Paenibacillus sediminis TaxID=664909 RepID=A0ABS4H0Y1_9BACL|nr:undecaprenyl-diphosphatase [Paenibacillus sediminis]